MNSLASFPPNENLNLPSLRIVGVSATVPNLVDFASWLTDSDGREAVVQSFGTDYRPVKIDQDVIGHSVSGSIDDSATAILLTTLDKKEYYENMGKQVIESCLHQSINNHLNTEIALGKIKTEDCAMKWLKSTFLYVRIKRNPSSYRLNDCSIEDSKLSVEILLESIFLKDLELLKKSSVVTSGVENRLEPQEFGEILTGISTIPHPRVNYLNQLNPAIKVISILTI